MAEPLARYLVALRAELGAIDWLVCKRADPKRTKTISAGTRLEAMLLVAKQNHLEFETLDAEVAR